MGFSRSSLQRTIAIGLAFLVAYFGAALWARELTVTGGAAPWYPGAGVAIGMLVACGIRYFPLLLVAELISAQVVFAVPYSLLQDALNTVGFTAALVGAAILMRRQMGRPPTLRDPASLRAFALGAVGGSIAAGLVGYSILAWAGVGAWSDFAEGWRAFAVGDAVGIVAVAPAIIAVAARDRPLRPPELRTITPATLAQALAIAGVPFIPLLFDGQRPGLLALSLVPLAWVALTRGFVATTIASLVTISATTVAAHAQLGDSIGLTDIQLFLISAALLVLGIAVVMRMFRRAQAELGLRASQDPLTGLPNRPYFIDEVARRLAGGQQVAVLFIDLDRFKLVNDTLGHGVGDALLQSIAGRLAHAGRRGEAGRGLISRFGGDEFTAVTDAGDVSAWIPGERMAQSVLSAFSRPVTLAGKEISIDVSVGIAVGQPGDEAEAVIARADLAMFAAKQRGGSCVALFDETMSARAERRTAIETGLREAVDGGLLTLAYQPILPMRAGAPAGVEALLRWRAADGELITPAEFIPVAEETGLILRIGRWVLTEACATAAGWQGAGGASPPPTVWVNCSAAELREPDFVEFVITTLERAGLEDDGRLGLELTEGVLVEDSESVLETLNRLRDAGVKLALDDFGTGYSSLGYLRRLPIDAIKIDRRFVSELTGVGAEDPVAATITDLAHRLGLVVVGEGIETQVQREALERLGCDLGQGYLLGRPGHSDDAVSVLRKGAFQHLGSG